MQFFNYSVQNQSSGTVDVHIDGAITDSPTQELLSQLWNDQTSTSFKSFRDKIPAGVKTLNVHINCTGGHVGDSLAIRDYLTELEGKGVTVNRKGRGIVASAGTYLLMGRNSELSENSWLMIHEVSGFACGTVRQVENQARALRQFNDHIVKLYAKQTGMTENAVGKLMDDETWFTAEEAKAKGFVAKVTGAVSFTNTIQNSAWPFKNAAILNAYNKQITMKKEAASATSASRPKNRFDRSYKFDPDNKEKATGTGTRNHVSSGRQPSAADNQGPLTERQRSAKLANRFGKLFGAPDKK